MTNEELQTARALLYDPEAGDPEAVLTSEWASVRHSAQVNLAGRALLAEVERLRNENATLRERLAVINDKWLPDYDRLCDRLDHVQDECDTAKAENAALREIARDLVNAYGESLEWSETAALDHIRDVVVQASTLLSEEAPHAES